MIIYIARENSDRTEGRGHSVDIGCYSDLDKAIERVRGRGVMGVGDGEVWEMEIPDPPFAITGALPKNRVYGYRKDLAGKWGYGFVDNRDAPIHDPEYQEYLRLKEKFDA